MKRLLNAYTKRSSNRFVLGTKTNSLEYQSKDIDRSQHIYNQVKRRYKAEWGMPEAGWGKLAAGWGMLEAGWGMP